MSRKPTAIRLSKTNEDTKTSTTPAGNSKTKANSQSNKEKSRHPRILAAPKMEETQDVFDQTPFLDLEPESHPISHLPVLKRGIGWFSIFFASITTLLSIVLVFQLEAIVQDLFAVHPIVGYIAIALSAIAAFALLSLMLKELISLMRLKRLSSLRHDAEQVLMGAKPAEKTLNQLISLYNSREDMKWHLEDLNSYQGEVLDGPDHLRIAEKCLMAPLDSEAKRIIAASAKRISVVTALNPSPVLDILFVGYQVLQMLRKIMALYGGKPAFFGAMKLVRMVAAHLAMTGGLAMSDTLLQQFIGKGLAGRLSTKLGEGTVNGIMATRIGLAAIDLCRPLPFSELERPSLKSFLGELFSKNS